MTKRLTYSYLLYLIPLGIFLFSYLSASALENASPQLSTALTLDFILTAPIAYFLIIRKKRISNLTAISLSILAIFIASYIFPPHHQGLIGSIKMIILPLLEITVLILILRKSYQIFSHFKKEDRASFDFFDFISKATAESLPKPFSKIFAAEILVFYYLFHPKGGSALSKGEYSYHKKGGSALILSTFIGIILVETFAIHVLINTWNHTIAWVLSCLSVYTCLQILSLIRSFAKRPISIDASQRKIELRYGFFSSAQIHIDMIGEIQVTARTLAEKENMIKLSPFGALDNHNLILHLEDTCEIESVYGVKKRSRKVGIFIDQKEEFIEEIMKIKNSQ